jgi:hypothetical protein
MSRNLRQPRTRAISSYPRSNSIGEIISIIVASVFGATLNVALKRLWKHTYGSYAPTNPARPGVKWSDALLWGVVAGSVAGIVKILTRFLSDLLRGRRG